MKNKIKYTPPVSAEAVIGLIPDEVLDRLSTETGVDRFVKKLHGKTVFKLFVYGLLTSSTISLRILEAIFASEKFQCLFHTSVHGVKHSALGMRLQRIKAEYFERIFSHLVSSHEVEDILFANRRVTIRKIDTTIVNLSSKLLKVGLDVNAGKKSLKFGVEINRGIPVNIQLFEGQKYCSEEEALPELVRRKREKNSTNIAIFDRGIQRKQTFLDFSKEGIAFISRATTQGFRVLESLPISEQLTETLVIKSDERVLFVHGHHDPEHPLRLITGTNWTTGAEMVFLTNIDFLSAGEITDLYRSRWEIETFFKFIKQELNFKHLLSRSENGIKACMYLTMIVAILLTIYKRMNGIVGWAVAKLKFVYDLEASIMHAWHDEMAPAFQTEETRFAARFRGG